MAARRLLLVATIAFFASVIGVFAGRALMSSAPPETELHALLHKGLGLTADQHTQLKALERDFDVRKTRLELEMRRNNAVLADAIATEHGYGPRVAQAVDLSHAAMGQLQKATLEHVLAMRRVLTPEQAARYDKAVVKALTQDKR